MMRDEDELDPRWQEIERELQRQPRVDPAAVDRVMAAVQAARMESAGAPRRMQWLTRPAITLSPLQAAAAVALFAVGAWLLARRGGDAGGSDAGRLAQAAEQSVRGGDTPAVLAGGEGLRRPVQFVFVASGAREVSLVGSFNDWDVQATPLQPAQNGVWSVVVPLEPGRYTYSFVVDGERWEPDANAPRAPADEFGSSNSVVFVEKGT